jgi:hypothetical protein
VPLTNSAHPAFTAQKRSTRRTPSLTSPLRRTTSQVPHSPSSPLALTHLQTSRDRHRVSCNLCHQPISGTRYKHLHRICSLTNVNLCAACESDGGGMHSLDHPLLKLRTPDSWIPVLGLGKPRHQSVASLEEGRGVRMRGARGLTTSTSTSTPTSTSSEGTQSLRSLSGYGGPSWLGYGFCEAGLGLTSSGATF